MSINRTNILESAAQVFSQKGYNGASMADIAEAVGLQKASLYHHFESKQEILAELLDQALALITERMAVVAESETAPDEKLNQAIRAYLTLLCEHVDLASVLLLEYRSLGDGLYKRHIQHRDKLEMMWRNLVREGVEAGTFQCESVSMTVRALLGIMNWTITWYRPEGKMSIEEIADQFTELFLDGLNNRSTNRKRKM